jgi:uncharacterized protein (DUF2237 family)
MGMFQRIVIILAATTLVACFSSDPSATRSQSVAAAQDDVAAPLPGAATPAATEGNGPGCIADSCDTGELPPPSAQLNALDGELQPCSTDPMTGWFRDGYCRTDARDRGVHVVCGEMNERFLAYTRAQGNDLSTPRGSFPGLKPGDKWCLCASRWEEARQAGMATPVVLEATNQKAAEIMKNATAVAP